MPGPAGCGHDVSYSTPIIKLPRNALLDQRRFSEIAGVISPTRPRPRQKGCVGRASRPGLLRALISPLGKAAAPAQDGNQESAAGSLQVGRDLLDKADLESRGHGREGDRRAHFPVFWRTASKKRCTAAAASRCNSSAAWKSEAMYSASSRLQPPSHKPRAKPRDPHTSRRRPAATPEPGPRQREEASLSPTVSEPCTLPSR
jgi:hypothetical protein